MNNIQLYSGMPYQRGYGLGGTFRRFFSWIVPILKKHAVPVIQDGLKEVGKTALGTAADIAKDSLNGVNIKDAFRDRTSAAIDSLKEKAERKLDGKGIKRSRKQKKKKFIIIKKRKHLKDIFD